MFLEFEDKPFTNEEWKGILEDFEQKCAYCTSGDNLTVEYIIPISAGGSNTRENVVPACKECKSRKYASDLEEYYS